MSTSENKYFTSLLLLFVTGFTSVSLQSAELPARGPIPFEAFDRDGNGSISEIEFYTVRGERMKARAAEGGQMRGAASAPAFTDLDLDGNGALSPEELNSGQSAQMGNRSGVARQQPPGMGKGMGRDMPTFAEYDLNGDGKMTEKEFNEARGMRIAKRAQQGYQMRNLGNAPTFSDIDTNGDGVIGVDEFAAHQSQHRRQFAQ